MSGRRSAALTRLPGCHFPGGGSSELRTVRLQRFGAHGSPTVRSQSRFVGEPQALASGPTFPAGMHLSPETFTPTLR